MSTKGEFHPATGQRVIHTSTAVWATTAPPRQFSEAADWRLLSAYLRRIAEAIGDIESLPDGKAPNWDELADECPDPIIPLAEWQRMVRSAESEWQSQEPDEASIREFAEEIREEDDTEDDLASLAQEERERQVNEQRNASAACLRRLAADFLRRYLEEPAPVTATQAANLSAREWEVVALVCNRRFDLPEAANTLGLQPGTARTHFEAAAKKLGLTVKDLRRRRLVNDP